MSRRNKLFFMALLILFALALCVVLPTNKGILGKRGIRLGLDLQGGIRLVYKADLSSVKPGDEKQAIDGVIAVIENRVNPLGVTEPLIQRVGEDQVTVELPGLSVTDVQKERIGRTALLEFREMITDKDGNEQWIPAKGIIDGQEKVLNSSYFKENTYVYRDELGKISIIFENDEQGSQLWGQVTERRIGKPLGVFEGESPLLGDNGRPIAPIVQSKITTLGEITGLSLKEATTLSAQLNAGRLPVPLNTILEEDVPPKLGAHFVDLSIKGGVIGIILVMLFMSIYYRLPGIISSLALVFYSTLVLAIFKLIPVTLTLAGIGGFIASIGMAVDANVLVFERMKEELRANQTLGGAIEAGFHRAWSAIWDSNLTTIIACGILYWVGSRSIVAGAPVKGFALTLAIGVVVSMFTAVFVTRTCLRLFVGTSLAQKTSLFTPYSGRGND